MLKCLSCDPCLSVSSLALRLSLSLSLFYLFSFSFSARITSLFWQNNCLYTILSLYRTSQTRTNPISQHTHTHSHRYTLTRPVLCNTVLLDYDSIVCVQRESRCVSRRYSGLRWKAGCLSCKEAEGEGELWGRERHGGGDVHVWSVCPCVWCVSVCVCVWCVLIKLLNSYLSILFLTGLCMKHTSPVIWSSWREYQPGLEWFLFE